MVNELRKAVWSGMVILGLMTIPPTISAQQELDPNRKATKTVTPVYPPVAKAARLSGTVKMVVLVTPEGTVKTVKTVGGNPVLVAAAEDAARQWKFEVAKRESNVLVSVRFGAAE
jgi:TonB family protein